MPKSKENPTARLKVIIISLTVGLLGMILLFVEALYSMQLPSWAADILQHLASVLIISGSLSAVTEYFLRADFVSEVRESEERLRLSMYTSDRVKRMGDYGIVDCYYDSGTYDYADFLTEAADVTICVNDGRSWLSANIGVLTQRMRDPSFHVTLVLVNPDSGYAKILADKTNVKLSYLSDKIRDTCRKTIDAYATIQGSKGNLSIYWHNLPLVHSVYLSDNKALTTPYTVSRQRATVPLIVASRAERPSYYEFIRQDLESLKKDPTTECVFLAKQGRVTKMSEAVGPR